MSFTVYMATFRTKGPLHVGIFVKTGQESGNVFHVVNANTPTDDANGIVRLSFQELEDFDPAEGPSPHDAVAIGTVLESNLDRLRSVCLNTSDVVAPDTSMLPNCATWFDNVTHDLQAEGIVSFNEEFRVPTLKKELQTVKQPGNSVSQSANLS